MLFTLAELSFILRVIERPCFDAEPLLLVFGPLAVVCIALKVGEFAVSARFVVFPLAHITVAVRMDHATAAMAHVVLPKTLVTGFVLILHDADPISDVLL